MAKTLTKTEKDIVDKFFVTYDIGTFDVPTFNLAVANTLPTWRTEELINNGKKSLAYIDYVKDLLRMQKNA